MCGIAGHVATRTSLNAKGRDISAVTDALFRLAQVRGTDAAGYAAFSAKGECLLDRSRGMDANSFLYRHGSKWKEARMKPFVVGHTRAGTGTDPMIHTNNHPFEGKLGNTVLVHNGVLHNHTSMREFLKEQGMDFDSETDSECLIRILELFGNEINIGAEACLQWMNGPQAVVLGDYGVKDPKVMMWRNTNPLHVAESKDYPGVVWYASTREILHYAFTYIGINAHISSLDEKTLYVIRPGKSTSFQLKPHRLMGIHLDEKEDITDEQRKIFEAYSKHNRTSFTATPAKGNGYSHRGSYQNWGPGWHDNMDDDFDDDKPLKRGDGKNLEVVKGGQVRGQYNRPQYLIEGFGECDVCQHQIATCKCAYFFNDGLLSLHPSLVDFAVALRQRGYKTEEAENLLFTVTESKKYPGMWECPHCEGSFLHLNVAGALCPLAGVMALPIYLEEEDGKGSASK